MRKSTLFVSAALTVFMLAVLAGTVSAVQNWTQASDSSSVAASLPTAAPVSEAIAPAPIEPQSISPQQAAALAAQVLNRTDLYSVESATLDGVDAYKVTFSSGDVIFLGLDGMVLSVQSAPVIAAAPVQPITSVSGNSGGQSGGGQSSGEHEESEREHEDDD